MKYDSRKLAALIAASLVIVVTSMASEGTVWQLVSGSASTSCGGGQVSCEIYEEWECEPLAIANNNCTEGTTKRENETTGWCFDGSCTTGS